MLKGLFIVIEMLFGVWIKLDDVLVWYKDVCFFCVENCDGLFVV